MAPASAEDRGAEETMNATRPHARRLAILGLFGLFLGSCSEEETTLPCDEPAPPGLPEFLCAVRGYGGVGVEEEQCRILRDLGVTYVQGYPDFTWGNLESSGNTMKWEGTDREMDRLAAWGLKTIGFVICPKLP
ncbi:MAG: hypothetical protein AABX97_07810, partial [Candidatus Thermoplasmatota archaeon]